MSMKQYLTACVVVAAVAASSMLLVPPAARTFEGLLLLFLGTFATG